MLFKVSNYYRNFLNEQSEKWSVLYNEITQFTDSKSLLNQAEVIRILNEQLDNKSTIVHAAGSIPGDIHKLWKAKDNQDYHSEYGYSCMGYEIAGALGVKMACPDREVYAFLGDGSYLMLNHELITAIQEGLKITVVLNDNKGYQCIHDLQKSCGGKSFGNEFKYRKNGRLEGESLEVNFVENAKSLGAKTFSCNSKDELISALKEAKNIEESCFIYIPVDKDYKIPGYSWWDVPPNEVSTLKSVQQARKNIEQNLLDQKFLY